MNARRKTVQVNDLSESRRILQSREFEVPDFGLGLRKLEEATDLTLPNITGMAERVLFLVNGPEHLQRRKAWMPFFRADNIGRWDDKIRAIAESAVAQLPETGEVELMDALSRPVVSLANCRLLGVPEENHRLTTLGRRKYPAWSNLSFRFAVRAAPKNSPPVLPPISDPSFPLKFPHPPLRHQCSISSVSPCRAIPPMMNVSGR